MTPDQVRALAGVVAEVRGGWVAPRERHDDAANETSWDIYSAGGRCEEVDVQRVPVPHEPTRWWIRVGGVERWPLDQPDEVSATLAEITDAIDTGMLT